MPQRDEYRTQRRPTPASGRYPELARDVPTTEEARREEMPLDRLPLPDYLRDLPQPPTAPDDAPHPERTP